MGEARSAQGADAIARGEFEVGVDPRLALQRRSTSACVCMHLVEKLLVVVIARRNIHGSTVPVEYSFLDSNQLDRNHPNRKLL